MVVTSTKTSNRHDVTRDEFTGAYEGDLTLGDRARLIASNGLVFLRRDYRTDTAAPPQFPYVQHADSIYFLIPKDAEFPDRQVRDAITPWLGQDVTEHGRYYLPEAEHDWTGSDEVTSGRIVDAINAYDLAVWEAQRLEEAKKLLERHSGDSRYYASQKPIDEVKPMMVDDFMLDRGVSVIYGPMDEFKTTFATDLAAHISVGAAWRGRTVRARPVIWYAFEGAEEVYARVKALESRLQGKKTPWGSHDLPFTVRERIPSDPRDWRLEVEQIAKFWDGIISARALTNDFPNDVEAYPGIDDTIQPLVVIDQMSLALNGEDEKGSKAVELVRRCLDLLVENWELVKGDTNFPTWPVASHVLLLHHPTKTGDDIGGHRAIPSDTHMLYRIRRPGKLGDIDRPMLAEVKPMRTKGMPLPSPMRFEVEIVPVPETQQSTTILKEKVAETPARLSPIIEALRAFDDGVELARQELNDCLDVLAAAGEKGEQAKRQARARYRKELEAHGLIEGIEDDNSGNTGRYRLTLGVTQ